MVYPIQLLMTFKNEYIVKNFSIEKVYIFINKKKLYKQWKKNSKGIEKAGYATYRKG